MLGHLLNNKIGCLGIANNLVPMTRSARAVLSAKVEHPVQAWLQKDAFNLVDYKVMAKYGGAHAKMKAKANAEHNNAVTVGTSNTTVSLLKWIGSYIDDTFPSKLDIETRFGQRNPATGAVRLKPKLRGTLANTYAASYAGDFMSYNAKKEYSKWQFAFLDKVSTGGTGPYNTRLWGMLNGSTKSTWVVQSAGIDRTIWSSSRRWLDPTR
ncbi:MAG: hypothetical protein AAGK98_12570 [Pseudomonadota bacterium]